jgi:hypothetical protein
VTRRDGLDAPHGSELFMMSLGVSDEPPRKRRASLTKAFGTGHQTPPCLPKHTQDTPRSTRVRWQTASTRGGCRIACHSTAGQDHGMKEANQGCPEDAPFQGVEVPTLSQSAWCSQASVQTMPQFVLVGLMCDWSPFVCVETALGHQLTK